MNIGVLASENSWHFQDLVRAAGSKHRILSVAFDDLLATVGHREATFCSGSENLRHLDRVIVRTMPAGSLQQVVFRMDFIHRLQQTGVIIVNPPQAIEIAVDKYRSLARIAAAGIAVPPTMVAESLPAALTCFESLDRDVVFKPLFGSMGNGIVRLTERDQAKSFFQRQIAAGQILYLQKFIDHADWDIRILILGEQIFSIRRCRTGHWLTNLSQGATASTHVPSSNEIALARNAAAAVGCEIAGVDLFYDCTSGQPMVCDVNAAPGWKGTSETIGEDLGRSYLDAVCWSGGRK